MAQSPDKGYSKVVISGAGPSKAPPGAMNIPTSPERIFYLYYFKSLVEPGNYDYKFIGFDEIDGHQCLNVQLSVFPEADMERMGDDRHRRFWIDIERGGHPVVVEFLRDGVVQMRSTISDISKITVEDGATVWLPVKGKLEQYIPIDELRASADSEPSVTETYSVVAGSVRLNQSLPDSYFTAKRKNANFYHLTLRNLQRELDAAPPRPVNRTDPVSVQARLDEQLALADRQADRLDASKPENAWSWVSIVRLSTGLLGIALITGIIIWKFMTTANFGRASR